MDDILNAILISIYANRVVFCIKPERGVARILRALGFDVSKHMMNITTLGHNKI